jgi:xanthosine utilization system XapX-like protein
MALVFHRGLAIPLWGTALCALALSPPSRPLPAVTALLGIAMAGSMMIAMSRLFGMRRPVTAGCSVAGSVGIVTGGMWVGNLQRPSPSPREETDDALDLVRMDDDGGWRVPLEPSPRR